MSMRCHSIRMTMFTWSLIAAATVAFGLASAVRAETEQAEVVATPLVATPIAPPIPCSAPTARSISPMRSCS